MWGKGTGVLGGEQGGAQGGIGIRGFASSRSPFNAYPLYAVGNNLCPDIVSHSSVADNKKAPGANDPGPNPSTGASFLLIKSRRQLRSVQLEAVAVGKKRRRGRFYIAPIPVIDRFVGRRVGP
jgi:hypothetical protein